MAYIYVITNQINQKEYVGKTLKAIEVRFLEHQRESKKERSIHRPLYHAFNKYGIKNFSISLLEECPNEKANEREIYWIKRKNTFRNGYNATLGGEGKIILDYKKIIFLYDTTNYSQKEIAKKCNCSIDSVRNIVRLYRDNVNWNQRYNQRQQPNNLGISGKTVKCVENNMVFPSATQAANWLVEIGKIKSQAYGRNHIPDVCKGKRKTVGSFHWTYID